MRRELIEMLESLAVDTNDPVDLVILRQLAQTMEAMDILERWMTADGPRDGHPDQTCGLQ